MLKALATAATVVLAAQAPAAAQIPGEDPTIATANLIDREGNPVGTAALVETPHGVLIQPQLRSLPPGAHAIHLHENGACEPPAFESAGGHYNPGERQHGIMNAEGAHAGDLPNIHVGEDGVLESDLLAVGVTLEEGAEGTLFPEGGTAIVIHAGPDDYRSDPAGNAGDRIACGVIEKPAP